jgi:hypothetical protein
MPRLKIGESSVCSMMIGYKVSRVVARWTHDIPSQGCVPIAFDNSHEQPIAESRLGGKPMVLYINANQ